MKIVMVNLRLTITQIVFPSINLPSNIWYFDIIKHLLLTVGLGPLNPLILDCQGRNSSLQILL